MLELFTMTFMLVGALYGDPQIPAAMASEQVSSQKPVVEIRRVIAKTTEEIVREYFAHSPALVEVARCESTFRHSNTEGKVIRGRYNRYDIGVMQINELYHADTAKELGLDLYDINGNLAYARWLYEREGLLPWKSSSKCWRTYPLIA